MRKKSLLRWLKSLPCELKDRLINYSDPARVFSLFAFDESIKSLDLRQVSTAKKIAVVSGSSREPELAFLGAEAEKVDVLSFEENPDLWDLSKDWDGDQYHHVRGGYDIVLCEQVLEHVPDPSLAFSNLCKLLNSQGILHISVPGINGVHGEPYFYYAGFHPRLLAFFAEREGLSLIDCSSWGCQKAARMYSCCDWAPLAISGGFEFLVQRFSLSKIKSLLLHGYRYPFQSFWRGPAQDNCSYPVIVWLLAKK